MPFASAPARPAPMRFDRATRTIRQEFRNMTSNPFFSPRRAGLGLAIAAGLLAAAPALAQEPTVNKGDTAWMLTATVLGSADDHSRPRPVLWRAGARQEHALGADARFLHGLRRHPDLGHLRLQPHLHRWIDSDRRLLQGLPHRRDHRGEDRDLLDRRQHSRNALRRVPDDLRRHHAGADRRSLRGAHQVLGRGAVCAAMGDVHLFPHRPHGLVLARPRRHRRRRESPSGRRRRHGQDRGAGEAR